MTVKEVDDLIKDITSKYVSLQVWCNLLEEIVQLPLVYVNYIWVCNGRLIWRTKAMEMDFGRFGCGVRKVDKVRNEMLVRHEKYN